MRVLSCAAGRGRMRRRLSRRAAQDPSAGTGTTTEKWLPATAANIANAQLAQFPSDYTQVSQTALEKANPAGR
jgi:hypothetical protein